MSRDQRRSLWIAHAVAGEIVRDPGRAIARARENLEKPAAKGSSRWLEEWRGLLEGSVEDLLDALTSTSLRSRELRQNSPFTGVLSPEVRERVLESFARATRRS